MPKPKVSNPSQQGGHRRPEPVSHTPVVNAKSTDYKSTSGQENGSSHGEPSSERHSDRLEIVVKVKELVRLSQEQGYLTYGDINDVLPDTLATPEDLDEIYTKLRGLEVEIVDQAEVDRVKEPEPEEEPEKNRLDILDDPVRMYLKQMGQVPLLTRDQEVEISKRIEAAETTVERLVHGFGFTAKEHIALAEKLICDPPRERFDRVIRDGKVEGREKHIKTLRKIVENVRGLDAQVDEAYRQIGLAKDPNQREEFVLQFQRLNRKLQSLFPKFYFKHTVIEEMTLVAENVHDKLQACLRLLREFEETRSMSSTMNCSRLRNPNSPLSRSLFECLARISCRTTSS
jgi:RNA polymerase primary sigma factor